MRRRLRASTEEPSYPAGDCPRMRRLDQPQGEVPLKPGQGADAAIRVGDDRGRDGGLFAAARVHGG